jgi:hypothetical protein
MLKVLDFFFILFHTCLIFFNLFGWISRKTRVWNLITLLLTGGSWFILGIFYGIGYCPFTDWHYQVLEKMGATNLPVSYIEYIVERFLPVDVNPQLVDLFTVGLFFTALILSTVLNSMDRFRHRKNEGNSSRN